MLGVWEFLVIAVVCWAIVEINKNYLKAKYKMPEHKKEKPTPEGLFIGGSILIAIGLAIFLSLYTFMGLGPWLMGGLIPAFIGIALIISYLALGKKKKWIFR